MDLIGIIVGLMVLMAAVLGGAMLMDRASCYASTHGIGYATNWGILSGCRINKDGKWLPLKNYRDME